MSVIDMTFDAGFGKFNFEGGSMAKQASLAASSIRAGGKECHISVSSSDVFGGAPGVRCLFDYSINQGEGEAWYFGQVQTPTDDGLVWELHQDSSLYNVPGVIAPFAIHRHSGAMCCRIATGDYQPSMPVWHPNDVLISSPKAGAWMAFVLHAHFTEQSNGFAEWFVDTSGKGVFDFTKPAYRYTGIQTIPTYRKNGVTGHKLYMQQGFYLSSGVSSTQSVVHGGSVRADTLAELQAWLGVTPPPPPPPTVDVPGAIAGMHAAIAELHLTDVYKARRDTDYATTHTGKAEALIASSIGKLGG